MLQDRFHLDTSDIDYIENNHFCDKIMASKSYIINEHFME